MPVSDLSRTNGGHGDPGWDWPSHAVGKQAKERLAVLSPTPVLASAELDSSDGNLQLASLQLWNQRAGLCQ